VKPLNRERSGDVRLSPRDVEIGDSADSVDPGDRLFANGRRSRAATLGKDTFIRLQIARGAVGVAKDVDHGHNKERPGSSGRSWAPVARLPAALSPEARWILSWPSLKVSECQLSMIEAGEHRRQIRGLQQESPGLCSRNLHVVAPVIAERGASERRQAAESQDDERREASRRGDHARNLTPQTERTPYVRLKALLASAARAKLLLEAIDFGSSRVRSLAR
jgi:hypothetical protein